MNAPSASLRSLSFPWILIVRSRGVVPCFLLSQADVKRGLATNPDDTDLLKVGRFSAALVFSSTRLACTRFVLHLILGSDRGFHRAFPSRREGVYTDVG